jgi:tetratricopeptide (TPR) repeat protein
MRQIIDKTSPRMIFLAGAVVIIVACFVAYSPAIKGGFIWDDDVYVTNNPLLTAPDGLYRIWFSTDTQSQYFPLTYTTFWVEHKLWGFNPMGYHIVNVMIHIINALLLWLILRRLSIPGAWFASAVFALHPVNVESVAWITERKNVLMLFFSLLSALCWMESITTDKFTLDNRLGRKTIIFYIGSLLLYALALFSKTTACTLPAAFILILWFRRSPLTFKRWMQVVPFIVMGIGMGLFAMWWENRHLGTRLVNLGLNPADKVLIAGRALCFYLWKLFWPAKITFSYPRWHIDSTAIRQYTWPVVSILAIVCAWLWRERLGRGVVTAILFFVAMLFPMLGFFKLYTFIYSFVADHYQYVASIGPITLVAAGCALVYQRSGKNMSFFILSAAGVLIITLGVLSWKQCHAYTDAKTLWLDTLKKNPDSWLAHGSIGKIFFEEGKYSEAKSHIEQKIQLASYIKTALPAKYALMHYDMAVVLQKLDRLDDAVVYYQKSLDVWEHFAMAHYQLAVILAVQGNIEQSRLYFLRALEITREKKDDKLAEAICRQLNLLERKSK